MASKPLEKMLEDMKLTPPKPARPLQSILTSDYIAPGHFRLTVDSKSLVNIFSGKEKALEANERCVLVLLVITDVTFAGCWVGSLEQIAGLPRVSAECKALCRSALEKYDPVEKLAIVFMTEQDGTCRHLELPKRLMRSIKAFDTTVFDTELGYACI